jgi:hypothetical protein
MVGINRNDADISLDYGTIMHMYLEIKWLIRIFKVFDIMRVPGKGDETWRYELTQHKGVPRSM